MSITINVTMSTTTMTKLSCHPPWWQSYRVIHQDDKVIMLSTMTTKLSCQPWRRQPPVSSLKFGGDLILHVLTHPSPYLQILTNAKNIREGRLWKRCGWTTFVMECKIKGVEIQVQGTRSKHHIIGKPKFRRNTYNTERKTLSFAFFSPFVNQVCPVV